MSVCSLSPLNHQSRVLISGRKLPARFTTTFWQEEQWENLLAEEEDDSRLFGVALNSSLWLSHRIYFIMYVTCSQTGPWCHLSAWHSHSTKKNIWVIWRFNPSIRADHHFCPWPLDPCWGLWAGFILLLCRRLSEVCCNTPDQHSGKQRPAEVKGKAAVAWRKKIEMKFYSEGPLILTAMRRQTVLVGICSSMRSLTARQEKMYK